MAHGFNSETFNVCNKTRSFGGYSEFTFNFV